MIIHLLGYPGVGKYTVGRALCARAVAADQPMVLIDNHLTGNAVLAAIGADGVSDIPARAWDHVRDIRAIVYRAIEELAPPTRAFVFTNVVPEADAAGAVTIEQLQRLASARDARYVPVMLHCAPDELRRRVAAPGRSDRHKWIDPDGVHEYTQRRVLLRPDGVFDLDVTELSPDDSASRILEHLAGLG